MSTNSQLVPLQVLKGLLKSDTADYQSAAQQLLAPSAAANGSAAAPIPRVIPSPGDGKTPTWAQQTAVPKSAICQFLLRSDIHILLPSSFFQMSIAIRNNRGADAGLLFVSTSQSSAHLQNPIKRHPKQRHTMMHGTGNFTCQRTCEYTSCNVVLLQSSGFM